MHSPPVRLDGRCGPSRQADRVRRLPGYDKPRRPRWSCNSTANGTGASAARGLAHYSQTSASSFMEYFSACARAYSPNLIRDRPPRRWVVPAREASARSDTPSRPRTTRPRRCSERDPSEIGCTPCRRYTRLESSCCVRSRWPLFGANGSRAVRILRRPPAHRAPRSQRAHHWMPVRRARR
jgi:hypothetical protein